MSKEYSWRDGWGLDYPHPLPPKPKISRPENIMRCICGGWLYKNQLCVTCALIEGEK